ncbi:UDP-2,3-diacylglucosamine diphosphatase [Ferrimonas marina]|uniref:UDP-2,3-diacylglucosamine hydrolase n=1 Tax=Ferrimonas marina TaxID=299255 RepID=A0A1M5Y9E7_9GAMM|nr:UDP-2,3-diacylglucosamine diphosphatase [Ferrimonas marina]SHI08539.1 UDP-2,3-diacylglucosamine hydrolase [Ferrimonas marina]
MQSNASNAGAAQRGPRTLVIGDLHLCPSRPDITAAFARFLDEQLDGAEALYIVGDLFEFWIGDDDINPFTDEVAALLHRASQRLPIYFIHGNRDFALGQHYAARCGMTLLPEVAKLDLYGKPTVILHGDSLCTDDVEYQKFRRLRNRRWFRVVTAAMPLKLRRYLSDKGRAKSKQKAQQSDYKPVDVTAHAVADLMAQQHAVQMIHGHTHRPAIHDLDNGQQRLVVGDWYDQQSALIVTPEGAQLTSDAL